MKTASTQSAGKVLELLKILMPHYVDGLSPGELAKASGLPASAITRYVATLEAAGCAERISETGRIRPGLVWAQLCVAMLRDVDHAKSRLDELQARLMNYR